MAKRLLTARLQVRALPGEPKTTRGSPDTGRAPRRLSGLRMWYVYLFNRREQLYTGITTDLAHRMRQHSAELLYSEGFADKHLTARREREIKGWRRDKKLAFIRSLQVSLP